MFSPRSPILLRAFCKTGTVESPLKNIGETPNQSARFADHLPSCKPEVGRPRLHPTRGSYSKFPSFTVRRRVPLGGGMAIEASALTDGRAQVSRSDAVVRAMTDNACSERIRLAVDRVEGREALRVAGARAQALIEQGRSVVTRLLQRTLVALRPARRTDAVVARIGGVLRRGGACVDRAAASSGCQRAACRDHSARSAIPSCNCSARGDRACRVFGAASRRSTAV